MTHNQIRRNFKKAGHLPICARVARKHILKLDVRVDRLEQKLKRFKQ